jgi:hypothetical protein
MRGGPERGRDRERLKERERGEAGRGRDRVQEGFTEFCLFKLIRGSLCTLFFTIAVQGPCYSQDPCTGDPGLRRRVDLLGARRSFLTIIVCLIRYGHSDTCSVLLVVS